MSEEQSCRYLVLTPSEDLALALHEALGGELYWIPLVTFRPVEGWESRLAKALESCSVLGVTSPRGARQLSQTPWIVENVSSLYATGPVTARLLAEALGMEARHPDQEYGVRAMLEEAARDGVGCLVLARSEAALGTAPRVEGIQVLEVPIYKPIVSRGMLEEAWRLEVDVVILTSGMIAREYCSGKPTARAAVAIGRESGKAVLDRCPPLYLAMPPRAGRREIGLAATCACRLVKGL